MRVFDDARLDTPFLAMPASGGVICFAERWRLLQQPQATEFYTWNRLISVIDLGTIVPTMSTVFAGSELSAALFGQTRRAILALLYGHPDQAYYLRQLVRSAGLGLGAAQREVKRLSDAGIIRRTVSGHQVFYQANPDCPIFGELKSLMVKTTGVADVLQAALAPWRRKSGWHSSMARSPSLHRETAVT